MTDPTLRQAIEIVLEHEGFDKFTNDPADPGKATKWGVSLRTLKAEGWDIDRDGDVDADDVKALTRENAESFYRAVFWDRYRYERIYYPSVAIKTFDLCVNMGPSAAHKCLQRACRACDIFTKDDGILGPKSIKAINLSPPTQLLRCLRSEAAGYYRCLVVANLDFEKFIGGWLKRAYS